MNIKNLRPMPLAGALLLAMLPALAEAQPRAQTIPWEEIAAREHSIRTARARVERQTQVVKSGFNATNRSTLVVDNEARVLRTGGSISGVGGELGPIAAAGLYLTPSLLSQYQVLEPSDNALAHLPPQVREAAREHRMAGDQRGFWPPPLQYQFFTQQFFTVFEEWEREPERWWTRVSPAEAADHPDWIGIESVPAENAVVRLVYWLDPVRDHAVVRVDEWHLKSGRRQATYQAEYQQVDATWYPSKVVTTQYAGLQPGEETVAVRLTATLDDVEINPQLSETELSPPRYPPGTRRQDDRFDPPLVYHEQEEPLTEADLFRIHQDPDAPERTYILKPEEPPVPVAWRRWPWLGLPAVGLLLAVPGWQLLRRQRTKRRG